MRTSVTGAIQSSTADIQPIGSVGPRRGDGPTFDSLLTVTLDGKPDGGTALTLVHERLEELAAAMPQVADGVAPGWQSVLDKLAEVTA